MGIDKWRNNKLNLIAKVKAKKIDVEGFIEREDLQRIMLGKGRVYIYVKTERGSVNTIFERKAFQTDYVAVTEIMDKKLKRQFGSLITAS